MEVLMIDRSIQLKSVYRFLLAISAILIILAISSTGSLFGAATTQNDKFVQGEALIKIRAGASEAFLNQLRIETDADRDKQILQVGAFNIRRIHSRSKSTEALISQLRANPNIIYAEPNYILQRDTVPNDPRFSELYGLLNTGQAIQGITGTAGADIKAEQAWSLATGTDTVVVGVVDTGVDYNHPDLAANMWSNPGGIGNCATGTHGFNAITGTCDPLDDHFHGTHVSGTIGAVGNNGVGVVGVNWRTSIMALKFLSSGGSGTTADAIEAIDFAVQAKIAGVNVRILSNSWGGGGFSQALLDVINKANDNDILFVAAAGNASSNNDTTPHYPSTYNAPNVLAVAATDNRDALASFSSFGATTVDLGAPGVNTLSTMPNNAYGYLSGTSMATPHVSGAAALILSTNPSLTTAELKNRIMGSVDLIPSLTGKTVTGGRLNVCNAIPGCAQTDFSVAINPSTQSAPNTINNTLSYSVFITRTGGHNAGVNLSVSGLPAGASGSFSPSTTTGNTSTLTITVNAGTAIGTYLFTVTGNDGVSSHTATSTLVITNQGFSISISPNSRTVTRNGGQISYTINITRTGGSGFPIDLSAIVPAPAAGFESITPNPNTGSSSTISFVVFATATPGNYVFTVTGVDKLTGLTRTATGKFKKN
jgi:serine protease